jgi:C4-dicarboxylate-specific signal transduction histidine kinase
MAKILVIDDSDIIIDIFNEQLQNTYEVHSASSGQEGLEKTKEIRPDIMFLDYLLPGMNGIEVLHKVREFDSACYIILMTGAGAEKVVSDAIENGVDEFFNKTDIEPFLASINFMISKYHKEMHRREMERDLERKVDERTRELKETQMLLVQTEKLSALGELTACVSHELHQPLNAIKIISQDILRDINKDRFDDSSIEQDIKDVLEQVDKMQEITNHMRIFARVPTIDSRVQANVNEVIDSLFKFINQQLIIRNIEVTRELTDDLPLVAGHPVKLEQVLMNLVINARDAIEKTRENDGFIKVKSYLQPDALKQGAQAIVVEVIDNGKGVPENIRDKIYQPFFTTKEPNKGTGLGLSVTKKIVEEFGGRVELESEEGEGSTFKIILPVSNQTNK